MQAEQFRNLKNFREYQKQIYDYINQQLVQLPLFFENQAKINNKDIMDDEYKLIREALLELTK